MNKQYEKIKGFIDEYKKHNVSTYASSAAFYLFLSIIPIIVLLVAIIPYTPMSKEGVLAILAELLPSSIDEFTEYVINEVYGKQPALLSISAILTLWSAAKGMQAISLGLNVINDVTETRNFIILRLRACLYTIGLLVFMLLSFVLFVAGRLLIQNIPTHWIPSDSILYSIIPYRFLIELVILSILFSFVYALVPNKKSHIHSQWKGAVFAAVLFTAFSWGFSTYLVYFPAFSMYGSLATVVILMIWIYVCMILLMTGASLNVFYKKNHLSWRKEKKEKIAKK